MATARMVSLGETFSAQVGESVTVSGTGLSVTFVAVASDNRCPPGVQCIVAGNATVSVALSGTGMSPATVSLTTDGPRTARFGTFTVEFVRLSFGQPAVAGLRVT